ncbi:conserved Plasmodium protein, unknown function [Plasmodium knowlesi strain H]|uniref:Uncharacterized protein n=3 Tax=Plasmodium knowlesi TaxID=5850 RepID=A0A5K1ULM4_PLAKH|nr:conserved Plasmodium protein, unknown function [Plasmodium knowlesi strain H]OTN66783.1 Uncharacterized protein PKNOH_S08498900 [Plasmodium knowlesi]CAA9986742.1 conserved Plasmodium protein, unknown function [Plasmodium knowlesi strain H]SBO23565.1 conserved Plasmodium protein, unknown function [Plasmodium knowlesi strain H]SBO25100.1 conserved Plasmodium protein, unknown function [Plasmodium knowlesi strain H]VVS76216.1 conserved Plasmodium protein, unknown function [Plasmodium knowlesi s|eukprot:XP_002257926.1 hypothetical protein, conserved in Plasmodium species [Plasmodium knowlesi strain H]
MIVLRKTKILCMKKYLSPLKCVYLRSNFATVNLDYQKSKKKKEYTGKRKLYSLFSDNSNICDRLMLLKNLPRDKNEKYEGISAEVIYKYLLNKYKKCFNYISFSEIIQSIKTFDELDKKFSRDGDFFVSIKGVDSSVLCKINEFEFSEKDLHFHRREVLGKICNRLIKYVHEMSGNELIHFMVYFFRWNKSDSKLSLFYNFYFNHVFDNLYLFGHEIYKVLFILNTYLINNDSSILFDEHLMGKNLFNVYNFRELKNKGNYSLKISKDEIYKKCYDKLLEDIDKIEKKNVVNILKLYVDNLSKNINIDRKLVDNVHNNLTDENVDYLVKLVNIYCDMIKKEAYCTVSVVSKLKDVILCISKFLKERENEKKFLSDVNYSTLLNSVNNKDVLNKIMDNTFGLLYEHLLKTFSNVKFENLQALSISLISIKNIHFTLLRRKYFTNNGLFSATLKFGLDVSNRFLEKCLKINNKDAVHIIHSSDDVASNGINLENFQKVKLEKRREYYFYKIENYFDFNFKLKASDLLSIKVLSNSFAKAEQVNNSYDFYLLFNNISCILYYFLVNKNTITRFNDTYIYVLNDLSYVYKNVKNRASHSSLIASGVQKLFCKNVLKVSDLYIKNIHEEKNFQRDQYVCSLIFLNNLFSDRIVLFEHINNVWYHVYKAYNYFKRNTMLSEDVISLILLTCSKFQFFTENNSNSRYHRKELISLKYNIMDDLTRNYLNTYKHISVDNLSKVLISLSNSKYRYEISEDLLLGTLKKEIAKVNAKKNGDSFACSKTTDNATAKTNRGNIPKEIAKRDLFINISKIIECLIKLDIFFYLKNRDTYVQLFMKAFCSTGLKSNLLKKLLYIANHLYVYEIYGYVSEILEKFVERYGQISYNFMENVENKLFEKIAYYISEDDYIEMSNTFCVLFYDYFESFHREKTYTNVLFLPKCGTHFTKLNYGGGGHDVVLETVQSNADNNPKNVMGAYSDNAENVVNQVGTLQNCENSTNKGFLKRSTHEADFFISDIVNFFKFLKIDRGKFILFQLYMYLSSSKKFQKSDASSSAFHMEVFRVLQEIHPKYLWVQNFNIKNEEGTFLYTIDIMLFQARGKGEGI